jgi:di/tripeptidase
MQLLKKLYRISTSSYQEDNMIRFIRNYLTKELELNPIVDKHGNIFVTKGEAKNYPILVSHTDTVFGQYSKSYEPILINNKTFIGFNNITGELEGLGADDKNGIWICLCALRNFPILKCAFFVGEEIGGIGSINCDMNFFSNAKYIIQCDRRGNSDCVTEINGTKIASNQFIKDLNLKHNNYREKRGLFTDVYNLVQRKVNVSCINLSCGYYDPHTPNEHTIVKDLYKCYNFVSYILNNCTNVYSHTCKKDYQFYQYDDWY